jgi:hypothetical protein
MGSWSWQLLRRHALDLAMPPRVDDLADESNLDATAVRFGIRSYLRRLPRKLALG